ncbi:MAG: TonB-dependent receptor [Paludibacter sp.]
MKKQFKNRFLIISLLFLANVTVALSQQLISGTVVDKNGETLIGVSVLVKGTTVGTVSDVNGKFSIKVKGASDVLQFSYVGYINQSLTVGTQKVLKVVMTEKSKDLEEVIVVGYGSQKKSDVTGSVISVKADEMNAIPTSSIAEMLRGQGAGVLVTQNSARPGGGSDILIRGAKSLSATAGNAPIYVVDGVPLSNIDDYNSQDFESVEILKDASSQAIYGARASNGVIIITTKRGKENKTTVEFSSYVAQQTVKKNFSLYNAEEWAQLKREANRGFIVKSDGSIIADYLNGNPVNGVYPNEQDFFGNAYKNLVNKNYTNWESLAMNPALQQKYDLSIRAGNKDTKLAVSLGYFSQDGMIAPADYQRANFRFNIDHKISKNLSVSLNSNYTYSNRNAEDDGFNSILLLSPLYSAYDSIGNLKPVLEDSKANPLWSNANHFDNTVKNNFVLNGIMDWEIVKGLKYRLNASLNSIYSKEGIYLTSKHEKGMSLNGSASIINNNYNAYLIENILSYDWKINAGNKMDITLVQSTDLRTTVNDQMSASGFATDELGYDFLSAGAKISQQIHHISPDNVVSFMGRLRYNLKEKYLFSLSTRLDGASVFGANNKWAYFPAASFGWRISEEDFLKDREWLSNLKLRTSYGSVGNKGIPPYQSQSLATPLAMQFGTSDAIIGFLPGSTLANPNLKWETTTTFNTALDLGFLNNRLSGTFEYYNSLTTDLLQKKLLSQTTGYLNQWDNIGTVQNQGFEASLSAMPIKQKDFTWTVSLNVSTNKNRIVSLTGKVDAFGNPVNDTDNNWFIGHNIKVYYDYQFSKIMQKGDSVKTYYTNKPLPGDILVNNINNDTIINDLDKVIIDTDPKWTAGFSSTIIWKGLEFSFDIYTVQGAIMRNSYLYDSNSGGSLSGALNGIKVDYWTVDNPSTTAPRPRITTMNYLSTIAYQDASYIRLRNLTIGYNFQKNLLKFLKINKFRIYASATNLLTFTKYLSFSPEASVGAYPEPKVVTIGLNASF